MTFKSDRPVGRYSIVPNSLVVDYDKTIIFRDRRGNPVFTLPNGGKLLITDGPRAEPKVYTCRFIDESHFKLAAKGEGSWPYHHDQFVERMESMRGCTYRPEKFDTRLGVYQRIYSDRTRLTKEGKPVTFRVMLAQEFDDFERRCYVSYCRSESVVAVSTSIVYPKKERYKEFIPAKEFLEMLHGERAMSETLNRMPPFTDLNIEFITAFITDNDEVGHVEPAGADAKGA